MTEGRAAGDCGAGVVPAEDVCAEAKLTCGRREVVLAALLPLLLSCELNTDIAVGVGDIDMLSAFEAFCKYADCAGAVAAGGAASAANAIASVAGAGAGAFAFC